MRGACGAHRRAVRAEDHARVATLREQISLAVSGANGCDYCAAAHGAGVKAQGADEAEARRNLKAESEDEKTAAALRFAQVPVDQKGWAEEGDIRAVREAGHGDQQILEIVAMVALNTLTNYTNHVAGTEVDFPALTESRQA